MEKYRVIAEYSGWTGEIGVRQFDEDCSSDGVILDFDGPKDKGMWFNNDEVELVEE